MKKLVLLFVLSFILVSPTSVMAGHDHSDSKSSGACPMSSGKASTCAKCGGEDETYSCPIASAVAKKAHMMLCNKEDLGLSAEQVETIKAIKLDTKKAAVKMDADMQIFMMDINARLSDENMDAEATKKMMDEQMSNMTASSKASVDAYAKLKAVLTPEQNAKCKEMCKQMCAKKK